MTEETLALTNSPSKFSTNLLEAASGDLFVADVLLLAVDRFLDDIIDITRPAAAGGTMPNQFVHHPSNLASALLSELREKINDAKVTIDTAVELAIREGLNRSDSVVRA